MRRLLLLLPAALAACGPASDYRPAVDLSGVDPERYETDLRDCKKAAELDRYGPVFAAALQGAALGTALGAAGGAFAAGSAPAAAETFTASEGYGAVAGTVAGATLGGTQVQEKVDERARVDQCLRNNGYRIGG